MGVGMPCDACNPVAGSRGVSRASCYDKRVPLPNYVAGILDSGIRAVSPASCFDKRVRQAFNMQTAPTCASWVMDARAIDSVNCDVIIAWSRRAIGGQPITKTLPDLVMPPPPPVAVLGGGCSSHARATMLLVVPYPINSPVRWGLPGDG